MNILNNVLYQKVRKTNRTPQKSTSNGNIFFLYIEIAMALKVDLHSNRKNFFFIRFY